MLPTKFRFIWQSGFRGDDFLEVKMHTFSICTLSTLQNITKTLAQNHREGQTGVK